MNCPSPERLREIAEHVYTLGAYTQAEEISLAADRLETLEKEHGKRAAN